MMRILNIQIMLLACSSEALENRNVLDFFLNLALRRMAWFCLLFSKVLEAKRSFSG